MAFGLSRLGPVAVAALCFAAWAVFLGGVAALQASCITAGAFATSAGYNVGCGKYFRFYWFIIAWEFVIVVAIFIGVVKIAHTRLALLALTAVSLVLYILAGNALLDGIYGNSLSGSHLNRMRAAAAGAIMTAAFNALLICVLGTTPEPVGDSTGAMTGAAGHKREVVYTPAAAPTTAGTVPVGTHAV